MPRRKKPWFRNGRNAWYIEINGKQHKLVDGPDDKDTRELAEREFHLLMVELADNPPVNGGNPTVASVCDAYLASNKRRLAPSTFYENRLYLQKFCDMHGSRLVCNCTPYDVEDWLLKHPEWESNWTQSFAIRVVKRTFNWATKMRLTPENPFADVELPYCESERRAITTEEFDALLDAAGRESRLGEILRFLWLTGCRPGELRNLRWQDIHLELECPAIIIKKHKTSSTQRVPKPRMIPVVPNLAGLLTTIAHRKEHGEYVFVTSRRKPWARSSIQQSVRRLRRKVGLAEDVVLYAIRHDFATSLVRNGNDMRTTADILGHKNVQTTEVYVHSTDQLPVLMAAMSRLSRSA